MASLTDAQAALGRMYKTLMERRRDVDLLDAAYRGEFKLHYASENFSEFFAERYKNFSDNWCEIVADAPHERLEVTGIRLKDQDKGDDQLWETWKRTDSDAFSDLTFLDAIISKRGYALVWGDDDDQAQVTWEHPSQCVIEYDPETRQRRWGLKAWMDDDFEYATVYHHLDGVWKFQRKRANTSGLILPGSFITGGWDQRGEGWMPNPLGKLPLVELPNRARLMGEPKSDISGTLAMQHAINLLWAQLFAVSDEATIGQRVIIGAEMPKMPILNSDGEIVGERPLDLKKLRRDNILWVESDNSGAKIGEWAPAKLDVFTNVIEIAVGHIAAQTRTPAHYLLIGGTIANVSGDAMKALETGLVKRTEEKTQHFGRGVRDVFELIALVESNPAKAADVRGGTVLWKDIENRSDAQRADALAKKREMGYPMRYIMELDGLPPQEIERVIKMLEDEQRVDPFNMLDPVTQGIVKGGAQVAAEPDASA